MSLDLDSTTHPFTLVLGASGKTGRRIVQRLEDRRVPVRRGSRVQTPAFDWNQEATWDPCLEGAKALYVSYVPDLAMPGAPDAIRLLSDKAQRHGVERLVLLSGRGEEGAQTCEQIVLGCGIPSTVVRASWFNQNFSEGAFVEMVRAGQITLSAGDIPEPFVDADDIADVAVAALTDPKHAGMIYDVTGPGALTFAEIAAELSTALERDIAYVQVPHEAFVAGVAQSGAPRDVVWMLDYLFSTVLDGRNAHVSDGVQQALGRAPKDFATYAREVATTGVWKAAH